MANLDPTANQATVANVTTAKSYTVNQTNEAISNVMRLDKASNPTVLLPSNEVGRADRVTVNSDGTCTLKGIFATLMDAGALLATVE